jgi:quercetin dioxygenase-like cupin family protein
MTMRSGEVYEHPFERLVIRVGTAESGGKELIADLYVPPDAPGVPRHIHPAMEERLTVICGKAGTWVAGQERILGPGDSVQVAPGEIHTWRPIGDEEVRILLEARPGNRFEAMWRQFMGLFQDGKTNAKGVPSFLQIAMISREFSDVAQMPGIPPVVQRILFDLLVPIARLRGCRGAYEEYLTRGPNAVVELEPLPAGFEPAGELLHGVSSSPETSGGVR